MARLILLCAAIATAQPRVRREIRSLSDDERARVFAALDVMKRTSQADGERRYGARFLNYDRLTVQHAYSAVHPACDQGHFSTSLLPFHLVESLAVEESLLAIDPAIGALPYWDYARDLDEYDDVEDSVVWTDGYFGEARGDPDDGWQIRTGPWANWTVPRNASPLFDGPPRVDLRDGVVSGVRANPYGYLRGWNNLNPAPRLTRGRDDCGVTPPPYNGLSSARWAECVALDNASYVDFLGCVDEGTASPHAFAHLWLGGAWGSDANCTAKHVKYTVADLASGCIVCPRCDDATPVEACVCAVDRAACEAADASGMCQRAGGLDGEVAWSPDAPCFHCGAACADGQLGASGDYWDGMTSTNDPVRPPSSTIANRILTLRLLPPPQIFWFHHPNVDRAFQAWQARVAGAPETPPPYFGFPASGFGPGNNLHDVINEFYPFRGALLGWTGERADAPLTIADVLEATALGRLYTYDTLAGASEQDFKRAADGSLLYAYYRDGNFDSETRIPTYAHDGSNETVWARAVAWNYSTYRIFDSIEDVHVARYDLSFRDNVSAVTLGAYADSCVRIGPGGAYFFTSSRMVTVEDVLGGADAEVVTFDFCSLATVAGGACVKITVERDPEMYHHGNSSLFVIAAGGADFDPTPACAATLSGVKKAHFRAGDEQLHNNAVRYEAEGTCANPIFGAPGAEASRRGVFTPAPPLRDLTRRPFRAGLRQPRRPAHPAAQLALPHARLAVLLRERERAVRRGRRAARARRAAIRRPRVLLRAGGARAEQLVPHRAARARPELDRLRRRRRRPRDARAVGRAVAAGNGGRRRRFQPVPHRVPRSAERDRRADALCLSRARAARAE